MMRPTPAAAAAVLLVACLVVTTAASDIYINAGGQAVGSAWRCDDGKYASDGSRTILLPSGSEKPWSIMESVARLAEPGRDLEYRVPVPRGVYEVWLIFSELDKSVAVGERTFTVAVNGQPVAAVGESLDVLSRTKKVGKALFINAWKFVSKDGHITVTLGRQKGTPMISGIAIRGNDADGVIGDWGLGKCGGEDGNVRPPAYDLCPQAGGVFIDASGSPSNSGYRCDKPAFTDGKSWVFKSPLRPRGKCSDVYSTHRLPAGGSNTLTYDIPAPPGDYKLHLMFMETYVDAVGKRLFEVLINGKAARGGGIYGVLDVYAQAGKNKPLKIVLDVAPKDGVVKVQFKRFLNKDNPMVSALALLGKGADRLVGDAGLKSCSALPRDGDNPPPRDDDECRGRPVETDFSKSHVAHAVSRGPYVVTDYKKDGKATVNLDGLGSHSHATFPQNGHITQYRWSWYDPTNGDADARGIVSVTAPTPAPTFPEGTTELTLEVRDQFCHKAMEKTTVTVSKAINPGAYCYFYDFIESAPQSVPLPFNPKQGQKPLYATQVGDINFKDTKSFGDFPFRMRSFAVRCVFTMEIKRRGWYRYAVAHSGPIEVYSESQLLARSRSYDVDRRTTTKLKHFTPGRYRFQVLYFRPDSVEGQLKFLFSNGRVVPEEVMRYDLSSILPVITSVSRTTALANEIITISGSGFFNGVVVRFGGVQAEPIISKVDSIQLRVPQQKGKEQVVDIVIDTFAGVSNGVTFRYGKPTKQCQVIEFEKTSLKKANSDDDFEIDNIAVIKYGPDGRLYVGSTHGRMHALTIDSELHVTKKCSKMLERQKEINRWILGIAFNPTSLQLKMYFTTSTVYWALSEPARPGFPMKFEEGWKNGKVHSVTLDGPTKCFNDDVKDVVTGLPVSTNDHGVNFLQFLPDGRLIIAVGGFTNGGVSAKGDGLGGIPAPPLAGALVECPYNSTAEITYTHPKEPGKTRFIDDGGCKLYATGFRNSFAGELHTNNHLYVTDNGPNQNFGAFSTDCKGGQVQDKNNPDKLFRVKVGDCHGHPNMGRGAKDPRQCVLNSAHCTQPIIDSLQSSTNGVVEYRSNFFAGALKGDLFLVKYSMGANKTGAMTRVQLTEDGALSELTPLFEDDSGLAIVEGPRGELIMSRVFKKSFLVYKPRCADRFDMTYLIGVHPRRGPAAGGHRVLITGYNFGRKPTAMFGSRPCTAVRSVDDESFTCVTPPGVAGTQVKVVAEGTTGENLQTDGSDYWYW